MFINDKFDSELYNGMKEYRKTFNKQYTSVQDQVRIGSGSVIMPVRINQQIIVGAGSVVTKNLEWIGGTYYGNPAKEVQS
jgi:acetyltransferase-like isoleucine patch superfamily enzyme